MCEKFLVKFISIFIHQEKKLFVRVKSSPETFSMCFYTLNKKSLDWKRKSFQRILEAVVIFYADSSASIGIKIRIIFKAIAVPIVCLNVLDLCYIYIQIRPGFYLKSGQDVPQGLSILQVKMIERKAHQTLAIYSNFEIPFWEGHRNLEWLIENEREPSSTSLSITPARTLKPK